MNNKLLISIPFIILTYFFIHFTTDYFYFLTPLTVLATFIKYVLAVGLLYFVVYKIFKNKQKLILAFSTILFFFLFFGAFIDTLSKYNIYTPATGIYIKLLLIFFVTTIIFLFIIRILSQPTTKKLLVFWIIYCTTVLIYDAGIFILSSKKEKKYLTKPAQLNINIKPNRPSVFYLLFDMYPSDTVFHKYFNYYNTALNSFLKQKDFFVAGNSHSLYNATFYSLSSTLNLDSLNFYNDTTIEKYKKILIALKRTERSQLLSAFQKSGYTFRNFSVFNLQDQPSPLQFNLNYRIENILTASTFFNRIYNEAEPDFLLAGRNIDLRFFKKSWSDKVKNDIRTLDSKFKNLLDTIAKDNKPGFNYFHFMIPHPPLLYDSNGHENKVSEMYFFNGLDKGIEKYISYTKYGNKKIQEMVNRIFETAGNNVVIIIQGDHGFREYSNLYPDEVRLGILNAVYLPNKNYTNFNDTMNPVFTFKQILNNQFGTSLN